VLPQQVLTREGFGGDRMVAVAGGCICKVCCCALPVTAKPIQRQQPTDIISSSGKETPSTLLCTKLHERQNAQRYCTETQSRTQQRRFFQLSHLL
jgi:hypothetical protein